MIIRRFPRRLPPAADPEEECSALFDGACGGETASRFLRRLARDPRLHRRYARYALISSAMRGQLTDTSLDDVCAERVAARLASDPPPAAPREGRYLGAALAAGLAVAVLATVALRGLLPFNPAALAPTVARAPRTAAASPGRVRLSAYGAPAPATWRRGAPAERRVLDEYLLIHLVTPGYAPVMVRARLATYETAWVRAGRRPRPRP